MKIIILAGGGGTRLFPLSRACYPKQFINIAGEQSLLAQTVARYLGMVEESDIVIVTNQDYVFHVKAELKSLGTDHIHVLTEPVGRNTAPAIALAILYCREILNCKEDEILFVGPSDHVIKPVEKFTKLVLSNMKVAQDGYIVTLGVTPDRPETGYGYIEAGSQNIGTAFKVQKFKEKPDITTAQGYIDAGNYYWNSGMFMFSIRTMTRELERFAPAIAELSGNGYDATVRSFYDMPDISIDFAVAEHSDFMVMVPMNEIYWNDIGSFDAISHMLGDEQGNAFDGDIMADGCHNTLILGSNRLIAGIDLQDVMVVDTPDVLLVAKRGESQKVKQLVSTLKAANRREVVENVTMYRPWGSYTVLSEGDGYKVKKIIIQPGRKLSLQMHYQRSEHWTVITGTGKLTLDNQEIIFRENESTYIPIGMRHRLENPGKIPLAIIEVQNGKYLGEDDIKRYDDEYERINK